MIRVQTTLNYIWLVFQSKSLKRHCVAHWHEQRCLDFFRQWQISQSDCEISSNCVKKSFFKCLGKYLVFANIKLFWLNNIFVVFRGLYCTEVIVLSWIFEQHLKFSVQYFRSLLRNLTGEQYEDVLNVCSMFPDIEMVIKPHGKSIS